MLLGAGLGAVAGSFLGTLVVRWPAGRALDGRSACDGCGATLRWFELIPLLSALLQHGRCRRCGARIDGDQAAIEWAAAAIGAGAVLGPLLATGRLEPATSAAWAALLWTLLTLAALDVRHLWLPDRLTLPLAIAGLAVGGFASGADAMQRGLGALAGFGSLWLIGAGYRALRGREGLGGGDPKLLGAIGAWLGWPALPFVLLAASVIGLLAAALGGDLKRDRAVAFGAALAAGTLPGWLAARLLLG